MCRYGMFGPYKRHFACFDCRKGFKRSAESESENDPAPCPDCGQKMADMGLDFKPPKRSAVEHWAVIEFLFQRGFAFHSCGCGGPGYRPSRWADVPAFLELHHTRSAGELLAVQFANRG